MKKIETLEKDLKKLERIVKIIESLESTEKSNLLKDTLSKIFFIETKIQNLKALSNF
jgi:hypothetical protein